jgi:hypothetical protein
LVVLQLARLKPMAPDAIWRSALSGYFQPSRARTNAGPAGVSAWLESALASQTFLRIHFDQNLGLTIAG